MMVGKPFSNIASKAVSLILEGQPDVLKEVIHKSDKLKLVDWCLRTGDELCRDRTIPMSKDLTKKVKDIYNKCKSGKGGDTPLILALDMGLMDMVWGFIECAKQTNTNLHTGQMGDRHVQQFFWQISNNPEHTAFDIAIDKNHMEVARLLLNNAPNWCLRLQWIRRREALLDLIKHDPKFEDFILEMFENPPASTAVNINGQLGDQLKIKNKGVETIITPEFLYNLDNGLLGSNGSKNTVLHLVSKIGNVACVDYILKKYHYDHLKCRNSDMETPAYVAAREGRVDILGHMINFVKRQNEDIESIVTRSFDKHNALHIAIQNHHLEVVFLLIREIPQLANRVNISEESPLYYAAEGGHTGVVKLLLKCKEISFKGPNGKTALHAAAIANSPECLEYLLNRNGNLLTAKDSRGWTAFCHAVYHNSCLATKKLLEADRSLGYHELIEENGINTSAIHFAASLGHCETMEVLMELCPGCSDFIDKEGRNILHVAIKNKKNKAIEFLFGDESLTNLINQKDKNGDTPIHLLDASDFEKMVILYHSRADINSIHNKELTQSDMIFSDDQSRRRLIKTITTGTRCTHDKTNALSPKIKNKSERNEIKSEAIQKETTTQFVIVDSLVVVAALIATASFAAAFTLPGGFDSSDSSKQGTPFLLGKPAFEAFIIINALAFSLSCCSLLRYIELLLYRNSYDELSPDKKELVDRKIMDMYLLTTVALVAMTIAFVTGLYVVLTPSPVLAIFVSVLTLFIRGIYHINSWKASWMLRFKENKQKKTKKQNCSLMIEE